MSLVEGDFAKRNGDILLQGWLNAERWGARIQASIHCSCPSRFCFRIPASLLSVPLGLNKSIVSKRRSSKDLKLLYAEFSKHASRCFPSPKILLSLSSPCICGIKIALCVVPRWDLLYDHLRLVLPDHPGTLPRRPSNFAEAFWSFFPLA